MKFTGSLVLGLLVGACAHSPPLPAHPTKTPTELARDMRAETVVLVHENKAYCSGVWVSERAFITAAHCILEDEDGEPSYSVDFATSSDVFGPGASLLERKVVGIHRAGVPVRDERHDIAIGRVDNPPPHRIAHLTLNGIAPGAKVFAMGHPRGLWWSMASGDIAAIRWVEGQAWIQATAPTSPGCSGGPLYNEEGELIGLTSRGLTRAQNVNLFVHAQDIHDLMVKHKDEL